MQVAFSWGNGNYFQTEFLVTGVNVAHTNFIIDLGSGYLKCGPRHSTTPLVIPAAWKISQAKSGKSVFRTFDPGRRNWLFPLENGMLPKDSTAVMNLCDICLDLFPQLNQQRDSLDIILLVFPLSSADQVTDLCQSLQETLGCSSMDAAIQQILTWRYWGRKTALIVDIGYTISFVAPIYRGFLLEEQIISVVTGSFFVSSAIRKLLFYLSESASSNEAALYSNMASSAKAISDIKQSLCQIQLTESAEGLEEKAKFVFQGAEVSLGSLPWQAPEVLFQPTLLGVGDKGLTDAVLEVLQQVDSTVRAELASNILLTGGGSMMPGLKIRLEHDLKTQLPHLAVKVYELQDPIYSSWFGAAKV